LAGSSDSVGDERTLKPVNKTMNEMKPYPRVKRALRWIAASIGMLVLLDWALDGRIRRRLARFRASKPTES